MDLGQGIKYTIDKLDASNFHVWKRKITLMLSLKDLDYVLTSDIPDENSDEYKVWEKDNIKACAMIGLTISDDHFEQVQHTSDAKEMWRLILDIYEKHTLLNKLRSPARFAREVASTLRLAELGRLDISIQGNFRRSSLFVGPVGLRRTVSGVFESRWIPKNRHTTSVLLTFSSLVFYLWYWSEVR